MTAPELIVLDLAGTTFDDGGAVLAAFQSALASAGVSVLPEQLNAVRGANKLQVFRALAAAQFGPSPEAVRAATEAMAHFNDELAIQFRDGPVDFLPGVQDALRSLRAAGLKLASNTGFSRPLAERVLARLRRGGDLFDVNVCGDDVPSGRPAPYMIHLAMERAGIHVAASVVAVGDTPLDLQAGTNAGAGGVVGVLSGAHDWRTLGASRHTHLIPSVAELPAVLYDQFGVTRPSP